MQTSIWPLKKVIVDNHGLKVFESEVLIDQKSLTNIFSCIMKKNTVKIKYGRESEPDVGEFYRILKLGGVGELLDLRNLKKLKSRS